MTKIEPKTKYVFGSLLALVLVASVLLVQPARAQTDQDISITQTADPNPATVGQPLTLAVTVTNNSVPQHVGLQDFLPPGMELVSATPSQGTCGASPHGINGVECTFGDLASGGSATVGIVVTPTVPGTMTNTAVSGGKSAPTQRDAATITVNPA
jgi:uncharacterized repeat protein (TIGR01451 family)